MITLDQITGGVVGILIGAAGAFGVAYRYLSRSISSAEANEIYNKAMVAMVEYNRAKADGTITVEEKLRIAEKTLSTLETVIKSLES